MHGFKTPGLVATIGLVLCGTPGTASAQDRTPTLEEAQAQLRALFDRATELAREQQRVQPLAEGETRPLKAVIMQTDGRCQWRENDQSAWKTARADDLLDPSAEIRTALRSSTAVRLGQNGSLLVGQSSRVVLPQVGQEGSTLVTTVQLTRGRADFKVDRVGLTNDFSIVTPSTTLSVRGSSVRVQYGGLKGTETFASPDNELDAIEVRYFLTKLVAFLSGGAVTSDGVQDPVMAALFQSIGPPTLISAFLQALIDRAAAVGAEELLTQLLGLDYEAYQMNIDPGDLFTCSLDEGGGGGGLNALQTLQVQSVSPCDLCIQLPIILSNWAAGLVGTGILDPLDRDTIDAFTQLSQITLPGQCPPDLFTFGEFFDDIDRFCQDHTTNPALCVELFNQAAGIE